MTGIEQLRKLGADAVRGGEVGRAICDIADQIEHEMVPKSDISPATDAQNPSCADHADAASASSEAPKVTRDPAEDVSMSAYDLLPQEDRDAIAWVREHGGLERVKQQRRESMPRAFYERKRRGWLDHIAECETALGKRREAIARLASENDALSLECAQMRPRLMPEGMEWPRFEDGAPVRFGDVVSDGDETGRVYYVTFDTVNPVIIGFTDETPDQDPGTWLEVSVNDGERVKRHAKVLAGDNEPLYRGEYVWHEDGTKLMVLDFLHEEDGETIVKVSRVSGPTDWGECRSLSLTHERPDSLDRLAEDIGAMVVAWRANKDLFDAQEAAAGCVGENTMGAAFDSLVFRIKALAGGA